MRVAVLILGLTELLLMVLVGCTAAGLDVLAHGAGTSEGLPATGGLWFPLMLLLVLVGSAFALGRPRFAGASFLLGGLVGLGNLFNGLIVLMPVWGVVCLILAVLCFLGSRELRPKRAAATQ